MYGSVREALLSAYHHEHRAWPAISRLLQDLRQDHDRTTSDLTMLDMIAQSGMTQQCAREALTGPQWALLEARYVHLPGYRVWLSRGGTAARVPAWSVVPVLQAARRRKILAAHATLTRIAPQIARSPWRWRVVSMQVWTGLRRVGPRASEWARQYGKSPSTVSRWGLADPADRRGVGMLRLLDVELAAAEGRLVEPFREVGLIP
jgi:hypothetical protein